MATSFCAPGKGQEFIDRGPMRAKGDIEGVALLRRIVSRISKPTPFEDWLRELVEFLTSAVRCDACFLYVLEGDELVLRASNHPYGKVVGGLKLKPGHALTDWLTGHKQPAVIAQRAGSELHFNFFNKGPDTGFDSFLSVPMLSRGRLVGIINLLNRNCRQYWDREIELASMIAFLVATEIEMAKLEEQNAELCQRLRARTLVERAKGILQSDLAISESEAYQRLRFQSQQLRKPMKEIAEAIVLSHTVKRGSHE